MPYDEIGEVLGLSVPAVKSVLFRARAELRENLRKYLEG
jgi:RNA polymerase sigma-70 factor (ECF subfamily)